MNKRIAKKRYKKALSSMKCYIPGISAVLITNHIFADKNGKVCDPAQEDARFIKLKRPRIQYMKKSSESKGSVDTLCVGEIKDDFGTSGKILFSSSPSLHKELLEQKRIK